MAQKTVQWLIGCILTDGELRERFVEGPRDTLETLRGQGHDLTDDEIAAVAATDSRLWLRGPKWLDSRLQRYPIARALVLLLALAIPIRAHAQTLDVFVRGAAEHNFDNREARSIAAQRVHEASQAWARLLPTVTVQSDYIRNQYLGEAFIPTGAPGIAGILPTRHVVVTPVNQWDVTFSAAMTLIDVASWDNARAGTANQEAQRARVAAATLDVQKTVVRTYYQLIGAGAVARAARRTLAAAEDNARYIETRVGAGLASDLDLKRAVAEVERDHQAIEDADYSAATLARSLETLTGITPAAALTTGDEAAPRDDLREEPPLAEWAAGLDQLPSVRAAAIDQRAASWTASASRAALFPTLSTTFTERATNAYGFGQSPYYTFEILGTFKLDRSNVEAARAQRAAGDTSVVRYDRARATAADTLFDDWHNVQTQLAKTRAARSSLDSSQVALSVARERYAAGRATQLDVIQAERDAFSAEVTEIQAEADLASARNVLRLSAGRSVEAK